MLNQSIQLHKLQSIIFTTHIGTEIARDSPLHSAPFQHCHDISFLVVVMFQARSIDCDRSRIVFDFGSRDVDLEHSVLVLRRHRLDVRVFRQMHNAFH